MVEESNLDQLVHEINVRRRWLSTFSFQCRKCDGHLRIVGISMFPKWICDKCKKVFRIEPLKIVNGESNEK